MTYKPTEAEKAEVFQRGYEDAMNGEYSPPKGDALVDFVFAPLNKLIGDPSSSEIADATVKSYIEGHAKGRGA